MILKIYAIRDKQAQYFYKPFYCHTHGEAERNFSQALQDPNSTISKYPEDFGLWYLGTYDDNSGAITPVDPEKIIDAVQFKTDSGQPRVSEI